MYQVVNTTTTKIHRENIMTMAMEDFLTYKPLVGDDICVVKVMNTIRATVPVITQTKVASVGQKYFTLEALPNYKFHINGKYAHKDVHSFPSNYKLYPSEDAYNDRIEALKLVDAIAMFTTKACLNKDSAVLNIPISKLKEVCELLGINA